MIDLDKMSQNMATIRTIALQCGLPPHAPRDVIYKAFTEKCQAMDKKIQMLEDELRELNERS